MKNVEELRQSWIYRFLIHPFLDAKGYGSMPAWAVFAILAAMVLRLMPHQDTNGGWFFAPVGWPEAFIVFSTFLGIPLYEAAMTLARLNPEKLLELISSRLGVGDVANVASGAGEYMIDTERPRVRPDPE